KGVEILTPHETRRTRRHAMNEHQRQPRFTGTGSFVKDPAVLPIVKVGLTSKRAIVGFHRPPANGCIHSRERRHTCAPRKDCLPQVSDLTQTLVPRYTE